MADLEVSFSADTAPLEAGANAARGVVSDAAKAMQGALVDLATGASAALAELGTVGASALGALGASGLGLGQVMATALGGAGQSWQGFGQVVADISRLGVADILSFGESAGSSIRVLGSALGEFAGSLPFGTIIKAGIETATTGLYNLAEGAIKSEAEIALLARTTGLSTETLSRLKVAAAELGVPFDAFRGGVVNLRDALDEVGPNADKARATLEAMGISLEGLKGEDVGPVLFQLADKMAAFDNPTKAAALAVAVLGAGIGDKLMPALLQGGQGILTFMQEADRLGRTVNQSQATTAAQAEAIHRVREQEEAQFWQNLLTSLGEGVAAFSTEMSKPVATTEAAFAAIENAIKTGAERVRQGMAGASGPGRQGPRSAILAPPPEKIPTPDVPDDQKDEGFSDWSRQWQEIKAGNSNFFADLRGQEKEFWAGKKDLTEAGSADHAQVVGRIYELEKGLAVDGLRAQLADLDAEKEAADRGSDARVQAETRKMALIRQAYGAESLEAKQAQRELEAAARQHADELIRIETQKTAALGQLTQVAAETMLDYNKAQAEFGVISKREEAARAVDIEQQLYAVKLAALQREAELNATKVAEHQRALDAIELLQAEHGRKMQQLDTAERQAIVTSWSGYLAPINSALSGAVMGYLQGTQTIGQAVSRLGLGVVASFVSMGVNALTHWVATQVGLVAVTASGQAGQVGAVVGGEAAKTGATAAGAAARGGIELGASITSIALTAATAIKTIAIKAYEAFAGAYAAIAAIPYVGPVLAPAAAAVAFAAVIGVGASIASASGGWDQVPADQVAMLHKDEMVLSAPIASAVRDMTAIGGGADPASGSGAASAASSSPSAIEAHLHFHGPTDRAYFLGNKHLIAEAFAMAVRGGAPLPGGTRA